MKQHTLNDLIHFPYAFPPARAVCYQTHSHTCPTNTYVYMEGCYLWLKLNLHLQISVFVDERVMFRETNHFSSVCKFFCFVMKSMHVMSNNEQTRDAHEAGGSSTDKMSNNCVFPSGGKQQHTPPPLRRSVFFLSPPSFPTKTRPVVEWPVLFRPPWTTHGCTLRFRG